MKDSIYVTLQTFSRTMLKVIDLVLSLSLFFYSNTLRKNGRNGQKIKISLLRLMNIVRLDGLFGNHYFF